MRPKVVRICKMTGILLLGVLFLHINNNISVPCIFKRITNIPCAGCGSIRALTLLATGKVFTALYYNPVTVILAIIFIMTLLISIKDVLFETNTADKILHCRLTKTKYAFIIFVFLVNWVFNIIKFK